MSRSASFVSIPLMDAQARLRLDDAHLRSTKSAMQSDYPRSSLFNAAAEFPTQLSVEGHRALLRHSRRIEYLYFNCGTDARTFLTAYLSEVPAIAEIHRRFYAAVAADVFVADDLYDAALAALSLCHVADFWAAVPVGVAH